MNLLYYFLVRYLFPKRLMNCLPRSRWGNKLHSLKLFAKVHGRLPSNKKTFNDVLYKIKTSNEIENPLRVFTTDKEFAKLYIKAMVGDEYNIKTFAVIRNADELSTFTFPARCVIKPTSGSGEVIIKQETDEVDLNLLRSWFKIDYYAISRERNYKTLQQKIIVEEIVFNNANAEDIKFFCVNGKVKMIQYSFDRHSNHTQQLYDINWQPLNCTISPYPLSSKQAARPKNFSKMIEVAEKLASPFNFVRIDMYMPPALRNNFYIGEITHAHGSSLDTVKTNGKESPATAYDRITKTLFDK